MSLEPIDVAFRNAPRRVDAPAELPAWTPTGSADSESVNRFRVALGDTGDANPSERVWGMIDGWNESVHRTGTELSKTLNKPDVSEVDLLRLQVECHRITMTQNLMAKAGASVNETTQALLRGQ
ncbi:MAG: hypothetical protein LUC93_14585 [Planctomycetaceae bacterium]|nr:hypothetical protein [Planctomycetaceae bacterium]